jgi:putative membrane protein
MMYGYGWIWIILGAIALILFVALVVGLIVYAVSSSGRNRGTYYTPQPGQETAGGPEDPLEILRQRYARGEITREEYQAMREDLTH